MKWPYLQEAVVEAVSDAGGWVVWVWLRGGGIGWGAGGLLFCAKASSRASAEAEAVQRTRC